MDRAGSGRFGTPINRQPIILKAGDGTASWSYASGTIRPSNNAAANSLTVFQGLAEELYEIRFDQNSDTNGNPGDATSKWDRLELHDDVLRTPRIRRHSQDEWHRRGLECQGQRLRGAGAAARTWDQHRNGAGTDHGASPAPAR